jgi:hypothetical protein
VDPEEHLLASDSSPVRLTSPSAFYIVLLLVIHYRLTPQILYTIRRSIKSEIRSTKFETMPNDPNSNAKNGQQLGFVSNIGEFVL